MLFHRLTASIALLVCLTQSGVHGSAPNVNTTTGLVIGTQQLNNTVNGYLGIPYAQPPIGNRRFAYAELLTEYNSTVINGTTNPEPCIQYTGNTTAVQGVLDCLKLNVYVPTGTPPAEGYPVFIYNPGGGFVTTAGAGYFVNTVVSTHQNIIIVWINSRVGIEAYLSLPGLNAEGQTQYGTPTSGNFGVSDLITATLWVQNNIAAFGGNPNQLTFGGGSSGSINTAYVLTSPLTRGVLQGAVMNAGAELPFPTDLNTNTFLGQQIAAAGNCSNTTLNATAQVQCMRNLSPLEAANAYYAVLPLNIGAGASAGVTFSYATLRPIVDGYIIPDYPHIMWAKGNITRVNALLTDVANEGGAWVAGDTTWQPITAANPNGATYNDVLTFMVNFTSNSTARQLGYAAPVVFNETTAQILATVNTLNDVINSTYGSTYGPTFALADIITYGVFACPDRRLARVLTALGNSTWQYRYNYVQSGTAVSALGAIHGADSYSMYAFPANASNPQQVQLAQQLSQYLVNFVTNGNPNINANPNSTVTLPYWPVYNETAGLYLDIGAPGQLDNDTISPVVEPYGYQCDVLYDNILWNTSYTGNQSAIYYPGTHAYKYQAKLSHRMHRLLGN